MYVFGSGRCGWEWMRGLGLGFTNPAGTGGSVGRMSLLWLRWCRWAGGLDQVREGGVVLCLCEVRVWILCVDVRCLCIVLGGYLRI